MNKEVDSEALNTSVVVCKHSKKPMIYQRDGYGYFIACNNYPECQCCITLKENK